MMSLIAWRTLKLLFSLDAEKSLAIDTQYLESKIWIGGDVWAWKSRYCD